MAGIEGRGWAAPIYLPKPPRLHACITGHDSQEGLCGTWSSWVIAISGRLVAACGEAGGPQTRDSLLIFYVSDDLASWEETSCCCCCCCSIIRSVVRLRSHEASHQ
ncbi:hypothetical protein E2C01_012229 [Portunus trituberculatus]|uniref:Uncharacterized protein n=1 Tax=Portunus trituberculatus TaxID=210409 RepID=A0A5B7DDE1_PORTR|nr:hypothetical protein [Portunus trituberculatus]